MEDRDTTLRRVALQQALAHYAGTTKAGPVSPKDVIDVAKIFYDFLKGETK
jgi:hypothetical protein